MSQLPTRHELDRLHTHDCTCTAIGRIAEQSIPQVAQSWYMVRSISHPSVGSPLQSSKKPLHEPIWHAPVEQSPVALGGEQVAQRAPAVPQYVVVVPA